MTSTDGARPAPDADIGSTGCLGPPGPRDHDGPEVYYAAWANEGIDNWGRAPY